MLVAGFRSVAVLCVVATLAGGCEGTGAASGSAPEEGANTPVIDPALLAVLPAGVTADVVEEGRQLFLPCAICHGLDGLGNQLGPSLRDSSWTHIGGSLEEIERVVRDGIPAPKEYPVPMAPMGGGEFDDQELRAVAAYVYAISRE